MSMSLGMNPVAMEVSCGLSLAPFILSLSKSPSNQSPLFRRQPLHLGCSILSSTNTPQASGSYSKANMEGQSPEDGIRVENGEGGLPKVVLSTTTGSQAEVYLFGACVTSWKMPNGKDLLYVRKDAVFDGKKPISGGIPICFPQFGPGTMQQHGFARNLTWTLKESQSSPTLPFVVFELRDNSYSHSMWDYKFLATYKITLEPRRLLTELCIKNIDSKAFSFTAALHTYFRASAAEASVKGLKSSKTLNKDPDPKNPVPGIEERDNVDFPGFVDRIYLNAPSELVLVNGLGDTIFIQNQNWPDAVLWNPHLNAPAVYKDFVCVENAQFGETTLLPKEEWNAQQILSLA